MKNIKKIICCTLVGAFIFSATGCNVVQKTPSAIKKTVLAKVGKVKITQGLLDDKMASTIEQVKAQYGEAYAKDTALMESLKTEYLNQLNAMVTEEILYQEAEKVKLVPDKNKIEDEVTKEINSIKKLYFENDDAKFEQGLKDAGFTMETLRDQYKEEITLNPSNVAANRMVEYLYKDLTVTDKEVSDYYTTNKQTFITQPGAKLAHILVPTEQEAKDIKAKYDKGAKFEDLAKDFGTDSTKETGGELGGYYPYDYTGENQLDAEFVAAARKLNENEVSGPVKTQFGYHLIKATGVEKNPVDQKLDEVKDQIKSSLLQTKQGDKLNSQLEIWKKELKVTTYETKLTY